MSMIIVRYINGQTRYVQAQSWRQLDSESAPLGAILLRKTDDGSKLYAVKAAIQEVEEVAQETWEKQVAEHAKAEADAEAKRKADADAALLALLESKTLRGRLRKLLGRKP